ncbi:tyrosine-type recombinase/integrase [Rummeliibacillus suwonensis]|uniref:tyrosine-type recombinase/integrase n=1 Tax=Rummeliibacillus suwonensis TaxID=1306154 RepID=UPI001AAF9E15|nr:tyrosine-type recombinase/integrase [Rummeliibacillus suwonensis]
MQGGYYLQVLGKGNKRRDVPIKDKVLQSINMFRDARGQKSLSEADPLFTTNTGNAYTPSYLSQYVKKQLQLLPNDIFGNTGIKVTPHVFRHAFAIISNKVDVYDIMRSLGHEKIDTTMIYLDKLFKNEHNATHQWKPETFGEFI